MTKTCCLQAEGVTEIVVQQECLLSNVVARLPKMLSGIKVQEGVRICFDFIVDLQVFSGKWQEAGCVHGGPLNSFSTSPTVSNTHQSLRRKSVCPNATPLASPFSSVWATHCSGSLNSPTDCLMASVLNMQKTQAPWKYFSNREIDRSRHSMALEHQSFFVSNEACLWILEYDHSE